MGGLLDPTTQVALLIGGMSGLTVLLFIFAFAGGSSRRVSRRIQEVALRKTTSASQRPLPAATRSLARRTSSTPGIDRVFRMLPRREALVERLGKTGRQISVGQYMLVTIAVIIVVAGLVMAFARLGLIPSL